MATISINIPQMKVAKLREILELQDPEADVAVLIHGHPIPVNNFDEGVCTPQRPHGEFHIILKEA